MVLAKIREAGRVTRRALQPLFGGDLSHLPPHAHGHRMVTWWGMMGIVAIEGTAFVLAAAAYLYLASHSSYWPPQVPPSLGWGTAFTLVALASYLPNRWLHTRAEREDLASVRAGLVAMSLIGLALVAIRFFEFPALNVGHDDSAYGSITVTLLALHAVHLITDLVDTLVLTVLMFTRHAKGRRFADTAENAIYWDFVVFAWIPIYALIYWFPRWTGS
jgi:cytochrome c oxidase subunit III